MVHETPDPLVFFGEAKAMLKEGGRLLAVEPRMHVSKKAFETMVGDAEKAGLKAIDFPGKKGGYGALFTVDRH